MPDVSQRRRWSNWAGNVTATPARMLRPTSEESVAAVVRRAAEDGHHVRVVGAGHSFTPLVATDGVLLTLSALSGVVAVDRDAMTATVRAGTTLADLNAQLHAAGVALENLGDIDRQSVAGAIATGTHGTGGALPGLNAQVVGMRLVDGTGAVRDVPAETLPAARVALGALGVVTEVTLRVVPAYRLAQRVTKVPLDDLLTDWDHHVADHRHVEFYWLPYTWTTQAKFTDATDEPARGPGVRERVNDVVLENGAVWALNQLSRFAPPLAPVTNRLIAAGVTDVERVGDSHRVFASTRLVRFTEMEYALPRDGVREVITALDEVVRRERIPVSLPVEVRVAAADDAWLSTAYQRDSTYVAIHMIKGQDDDRWFRAAEEVFLAHGGRPHWGKRHHLDATALRLRYPRWDDFQSVRRDLDPAGVFTTPYVARVLGPAPQR